MDKCFLIITIFVAISFGAAVDKDVLDALGDGMDAFDTLNEEEFEKDFGIEPAEDPEEEAKRAEALDKNEEDVKKANEKFMEGEQTWWEAINEFANLPEDEFEANHTGLFKNATEYARGLLRIPVPIDEASERYLDQFRESRADDVPASYDSNALGHVSPVKHQGSCGSCVAFSTMAVIETVIKKATGAEFGDYSEQQLVDCGYDGYYNNGCNGASEHGYVKWITDKKIELTAEAWYPYKGTRNQCPSDLKHFNQGMFIRKYLLDLFDSLTISGAEITNSFWTKEGDEETLKKLVAKHGAVVSTVMAAGPFQNYEGGIFGGCTGDALDHAITVVGYGTENGQDYWLIKNSWGADWGEKGFIRLKRGVGMCGIGKEIAGVECSNVGGVTDAPPTTQAPCEDKYTNCPELAENKCFRFSEHCQKSCGLCPGMTPAASNTCYDNYDNCADLCSWIPDQCKKSCGKC